MSEVPVGSFISYGMNLTKVFDFKHSELNMKAFRLRKIFLCFLLYFSCGVEGLKCRTATESQQNNDFEYVVRMCLRHLKNESDMFDFYRIQNGFDSSQNKRYRDEISGDSNNNNNNNNNDNRNYYSRSKGYPEGFDRFWSSNSASKDRNRYNDDDRNGQNTDYDESDYFGLSRNGKDGRKKFRGRSQMPHTYQQQLQHDRDVHGRGNRDSSYFFFNRNKNKKPVFNGDKNDDSPLADIDPCVIHCIFQELQMVDNNGKPNKGLISQKMTQKIRNSELKNFIQESVDECFDAIDDENDYIGTSYLGNYNNNNNNNNNNRYRKPEIVCDWAKTFAMCLEDKGRENCDDWSEPVQKNHNYNNNNNNNSNNGNNKNSEDQRHKSKQNDRG